MNKSLAIIVAVGFALGCDDPAVRDKVDAILDHGIVEARAECTSDWNLPWTGWPNENVFAVQSLADGSKLYSFDHSITAVSTASPELVKFCGRSEACGQTAEWVDKSHGSSAELIVSFSLSGGEFKVVATGSDLVSWSLSSPYTFVTGDIETYCTGFNLDAFD